MWYSKMTKYSQHKSSFSNDANCKPVTMSKKKEIVRECNTIWLMLADECMGVRLRRLDEPKRQEYAYGMPAG